MIMARPDEVSYRGLRKQEGLPELVFSSPFPSPTFVLLLFPVSSTSITMAEHTAPYVSHYTSS